MSYRTLALSIATLSCMQVASAQAQTVYVAPGGVYVANGPVYVTPAPGYGAAGVVAPGNGYGPNGYGPNGYGPNGYGPPAVVTPGNGYGPPAVVAPGAGYAPGAVVVPGGGYAAPARVYAPPAYYGEREPAYAVRERGYAGVPVYASEFAPRPPAAVPYNGNGRCVVSLGYGRWQYCD